MKQDEFEKAYNEADLFDTLGTVGDNGEDWIQKVLGGYVLIFHRYAIFIKYEPTRKEGA